MSALASSLLFPHAPALSSAGSQAQVPAGAMGGDAFSSFFSKMWPSAVFSLWGAGALAGLLRAVIGKARIRGLTANVVRRVSSEHERLTSELAVRIGIARQVHILENPRCRVPFTCGLFRPTIFLPVYVGGWSKKRLKPVLIHELCHVKRADSLVQAAAHAICSLFWFVPFVWVAYTRLHLEQEKACDAGVVDAGMERRDYAACILDVAHRCCEPVPFAGLFFAGSRKRILEDRIHSIIKGGNTMKKGLFVFALAAFALCVLVLLSGSAGRKPLSNEEAYKRFVGRWVNTDYPGTRERAQVTVIRPDYVGEDWLFPDSTSPAGAWDIKVKKTWTDEEGYTYCQYFFQYTKGAFFFGVGLMRVDEDLKVWEVNVMSNRETGPYPEKIDPTANSLIPGVSWAYYYIYYRE
jgi:beta-lactamase regulating signal transducer with metallopeptidase domain